MKKRLIITASVVIVASVAWLSFSETTPKNDLTSRNIAALASVVGPPGEGGCQIYCRTNQQNRCYYETPNGTAGVCDGVRK